MRHIDCLILLSVLIIFFTTINLTIAHQRSSSNSSNTLPTSSSSSFSSSSSAVIPLPSTRLDGKLSTFNFTSKKLHKSISTSVDSLSSSSSNSSSYLSSSSSESSSNHHTIHLIDWRWAEVGNYFLIGTFLLIAAGVKICYHHSHSLSTHVPESCVLIVLGTLISFIFYLTNVHESKYVPKFDSDLFFYILLPPIILESAYSLYDRSFFNNIGTILLYAVVGTLINIALIGPSIYLMSKYGYLINLKIPLIECLVFATLISAVDPVAVLAIFQEVNINKALYFLVFGESLLNDAVVVTMYNIVKTLAQTDDIHPREFIKGFLGFFVVSGGGLLIGIFLGAISSIVTRFTSDVRVVEPLIVVVLAYISYIGAELFHFSGIIALIACGLMQSEYTRHNISKKSYTTIKYLTKTISSIADVIIFIFLGMVLVREDRKWDTGFVLLTTFFCIIYRFFSVFLLTFIANHFFQRLRTVNFSEQVLMAYGGLRGAIAFSLAIMLDRETIGHAEYFITATLFVILFTVFIMGSTTKPVVRFLQVKIHVKHEAKLFIEINNKAVETMLAGIEEVAGHRSENYWAQKLSRFNDNYIKAILIKGGAEKAGSIRTTYERIYEEKQEKQKLLIQQDKNGERGDQESPTTPKIRIQDSINIDPISLPKSPSVRGAGIGGSSVSGSTTPWNLRRSRTLPSHSMESPELGQRTLHRTASRGPKNEDVRAALADAFSKTAYYQYSGGINSVDDRIDQMTREQAIKGKWIAARSKISLAARAVRSRHLGQEPMQLASVVRAAKAVAAAKGRNKPDNRRSDGGLEEQV